MKLYQRGRSTLEMMGVLIIIGVLSSGIFWGVSYLLAKNTANNIQKRAHERAASIMTSPTLAQTKTGDALEALGFEAKEDGFSYSQKKVSDDSFSVSVKPVRKRVCEILLDMDTSGLKDLKVNEKTYEKAFCAETENTIEFVYAAGKLRRVPPLKFCDGNSIPCGDKCCSKGQKCCQGDCVSACTGIGMTGQHDTFTCECVCDAIKGFKKTTDSTACECEAKHHYEDGVCVCDNKRCEGGVLSADCECNCAVNGLKNKTGDDQKCVECNVDDDCSSKRCENNECIGCIENGDECTPGESTCCHVPVCTSDGFCCLESTADCHSNRDCCSGKCSAKTHKCCLGRGEICSDTSECCDAGDGAECALKEGYDYKACCVSIGRFCSSDASCCSGACSDEKTCCFPIGHTCEVGATDFCCEGTCSGGICCLGKEDKCTKNSDCCSNLCYKQHNMDTYGKCVTCLENEVTCKADSDCCSGHCDENTHRCSEACRASYQNCSQNDQCCDEGICINSICCPAGGFCSKEHCGECCPLNNAKECLWSWSSEAMSWEGDCSLENTSGAGVFGLDEYEHHQLSEQLLLYQGLKE